MNSTAAHTIGNTVGTMGATTVENYPNNSVNRNFGMETQMGRTVNYLNSNTNHHNNTNTTYQKTIPYSSAPMTFSHMCDNYHQPVIHPRMPQFTNQHLHFSSISVPQITQRVSSLYLAPEEISPVTSPQIGNHCISHPSNMAPTKRTDFYKEQQTYQMQTCQTQKIIHHNPHSQSNTMSPVTRANASRVFSLGMLLL